MSDTLEQLLDKLGKRELSNITNQLRQIPDAVKEIDAAMTRLYKVTNATNACYEEFFSSATVSAQKLGRTLSGFIDQTTAWAKLGFDVNKAKELAKVSSIYSNIGQIDDAAAISDLAAVIKAFNIEASDSLHIIDALNALSRQYVTNTSDLGAGLKFSASVLADAGNDLNQALALLAGGSTSLQNMEELSSLLNVAGMRLRGMKDELRAVGEEYDSIPPLKDIQTQVYHSTDGHVNILKDDGSSKSLYRQLEEISQIYFELSDSNRQSLTEIMFGESRAKQGLALMEAFQSGQIQKAYETAIASAGSAYEAQAGWLDSLEAKTLQFEAAFQSLSNTAFSSDLLKGFVDLGTTVIRMLDKIMEKFGTFPTLLAGIASGLSFKNLGKCI